MPFRTHAFQDPCLSGPVPFKENTPELAKMLPGEHFLGKMLQGNHFLKKMLPWRAFSEETAPPSGEHFLKRLLMGGPFS